MVSPPPPKIHLERSCSKYSFLQAHHILTWKCKNTVNYSVFATFT